MITEIAIQDGNLPVESVIDIMNEANIEAEMAEEAKSEHLIHALRSGELLIKARSVVPKGKWEQFVDTHWKYDRSTARRYMKLFRKRAELERVTSPAVSINAALKIVEAPKELPSANVLLDKTIGEFVTSIWGGSQTSKIKELIKHRDQYSLKQWETSKDAMRRAIEYLVGILKEMEND
jgi:hypothetical protein